MAKNKIQFQKGMSLVEFFQRYGQEEQCREQFFSNGAGRRGLNALCVVAVSIAS